MWIFVPLLGKHRAKEFEKKKTVCKGNLRTEGVIFMTVLRLWDLTIRLLAMIYSSIVFFCIKLIPKSMNLCENWSLLRCYYYYSTHPVKLCVACQAATSHHSCASDKPERALLFTLLMTCRKQSWKKKKITLHAWLTHTPRQPQTTPPACTKNNVFDALFTHWET